MNAICDAWVAYLRRSPFPGGCFLTTAMVEFDARPGPVNDAVKKVMQRWLALLEQEASTAIKAGELLAEADPKDVAFTINALAVGANCDFQLNRNPRSLQRPLCSASSSSAPTTTAQGSRKGASRIQGTSRQRASNGAKSSSCSAVSGSCRHSPLTELM